MRRSLERYAVRAPRKRYLLFASRRGRKDLRNASRRKVFDDEAAPEEIGLSRALRARGVRRSLVAADHSRPHVQGADAVLGFLERGGRYRDQCPRRSATAARARWRHRK